MRTPRPRGASQPKAGSREARAPRLCPEGQLRPSPARRDLAPRNAARPPPHRLAGRPARPPPAPPLRPARPRGEPPSHRCPPRVQNGGGGVQPRELVPSLPGLGTLGPRRLTDTVPRRRSSLFPTQGLESRATAPRIGRGRAGGGAEPGAGPGPPSPRP